MNAPAALDEVLASLFPDGHTVERGPFNTLQGIGRRGADGDIALIGITDGVPVGVDGALLLAGHALSVIEKGGATPILVLIDASIQTMTRRDELLGLNEYFAHLYKVLALAALRGHRTVGLLYGRHDRHPPVSGRPETRHPEFRRRGPARATPPCARSRAHRDNRRIASRDRRAADVRP
jgi:hypothetical protein